MERNNLGLQTTLKNMPRGEMETALENLANAAYDLRDSLLSVGMSSVGCASNSCNLNNLGSDMPNLCLIELMDWIDEVGQNPANAQTRTRQLDGYIQLIMNKVEPVATAPENRYDLPFLMRSLAHPRVYVVLEDMHKALSRVASVSAESTARKAA